MSTTQLKLSEYLDNELRMRYAPESILPYDDNSVIHRFFKTPLTATEAKQVKVMNENIVRMNYTLIKHAGIATEANPKSFTNPLTQHLLDELNLRPTKEDMQAIRDQKLKMCVVGYGGAMINMLYNMYLWSMELSETRIFEKLIVFEKDDLDFSNIMRMGKDIVYTYSPDFSKVYDEKVNTIKTMCKIDLLNVENELCKDRNVLRFSEWLADDSSTYIDSKGYFFVGAPTLETRNMLQDKKFFFMGHSDFEVDITYAPQGISSLAVETYGTIDIPVLLINLQLASAAFIKLLASGETFVPDTRLLDFDMKKWVEENPEKLKELFNV